MDMEVAILRFDLQRHAEYGRIIHVQVLSIPVNVLLRPRRIIASSRTLSERIEPEAHHELIFV